MTTKDQIAIAKLYTESFKDFSQVTTDFENAKHVDDKIKPYLDKKDKDDYNNKLDSFENFEGKLFKFYEIYGAGNVDVFNEKLPNGKGQRTKIFVYDKNDYKKKLVYDKIHEYGHGVTEDF